MEEIVTRSGITPVGSSKYRINRLRYHLLAYVISRQAKLNGLNSKYIIRCDDTNEKNTDRSFLYAYLDVLKEIGVCPDIWPYGKDNRGYNLFQSERTSIYHAYVQRLVNEGLAYLDSTGATFFDTCVFEAKFRHLLKNGRLQVLDISMGELLIDIRTSLNDKSGQTGLVPFPLTRSNGSPLFNIASPVDDALLGVTHVVRDKGKLSLLHNQEMVRIALGFPELKYVHAPFIVDNTNTKLVYDDYYGEATYQNFIERGILSKAIISYLLSTLVGSPEKFYDSIDDFAKSVNLTNIHKANTTFDPVVLEEHNKKAIETSTKLEYERALQNYLNHFDTKASQLLIAHDDIIDLLIASKRRFAECANIIKYVLEPRYDQIQSESRELIFLVLDKFSEAAVETNLSFENLLAEKTIDLIGVERKEYFQAVRYILTGEYHGYDLHKIIKYLFGGGLIKQRLETARTQILGFSH